MDFDKAMPQPAVQVFSTHIVAWLIVRVTSTQVMINRADFTGSCHGLVDFIDHATVYHIVEFQNILFCDFDF